VSAGYLIVALGSESGHFWERYTYLLTDPAHVLFELTLELITGVLLYPAFRLFLRTYRNRVHHEADREHGIIHYHSEQTETWGQSDGRHESHRNSHHRSDSGDG
jgi:hypothetical protein